MRDVSLFSNKNFGAGNLTIYHVLDDTVNLNAFIMEFTKLKNIIHCFIVCSMERCNITIHIILDRF